MTHPRTRRLRSSPGNGEGLPRDSQRFVIWNMGLIAKSGNPDAVDLFRQILLA